MRSFRSSLVLCVFLLLFPHLTHGSSSPGDLILENPGFGKKKPKSRKAKSSRNGVTPKPKSSLSKTKRKLLAPIKFLERHRNSITLVLGIVAFRREIHQILQKSLTRTIRDPQTGEIIQKVPLITFDPTSILKIIVFIEITRRIANKAKNSSFNDDQQKAEARSLVPIIAIALMRGNPGLGFLLSKILTSSSVFVPPIEQHYTFEDVNHRYKKDSLAFAKAYRSSGDLHHQSNPFGTSIAHAFMKNRTKETECYTDTVIIMDLTKLDTSLSQLDRIRDQVSFLLCQERIDTTKRITSSETIEVLVLLESSGGSASDYALAAQQIRRLGQHPGVNLTIAVDKVAASGGYMVACTAGKNSLLASPFAIVGSIGVIGQTLNIQKALKDFGVTPLVFRGGKDKAPVGLIGDVTKEGVSKVQEMVDDTHRAFKRHIVESRPSLSDSIDKIATGRVWIGYEALEAGLVDRLISSDEYVEERISQGARILRLVSIARTKNPFKPFSTVISGYFDSFTRTVWHSVTGMFCGMP